MKKGLKDFCNDLLNSVSERRTTFRFVFPEILHFTLIELLVSTACKMGVLWAKTHKKTDASDTSDCVFFKKNNACGASASCTESALHICRRQMLHTFVCLTRRSVQNTKCFTQSAFTLIELLVSATC